MASCPPPPAQRLTWVEQLALVAHAGAHGAGSATSAGLPRMGPAQPGSARRGPAPGERPAPGPPGTVPAPGPPGRGEKQREELLGAEGRRRRSRRLPRAGGSPGSRRKPPGARPGRCAQDARHAAPLC